MSINDRNIFKKFTVSLGKHRMFNFMVSILLLIILSAIFEGATYLKYILSVIVIIVFASAIYVVSSKKLDVIILIILGSPWLISSLSFGKLINPNLLAVLFFGYSAIIILDDILETKQVNANTLFGAICVYLLLGLFWTSIYQLLEQLSTGIVFTGNILGEGIKNIEVLYYSFTTLTTLGYGDITILTPLGRILSVLEAIIGQLFLAFLVARLVAIYTASTIRKEYK